MSRKTELQTSTALRLRAVFQFNAFVAVGCTRMPQTYRISILKQQTAYFKRSAPLNGIPTIL